MKKATMILFDQHIWRGLPYPLHPTLSAACQVQSLELVSPCPSTKRKPKAETLGLSSGGNSEHCETWSWNNTLLTLKEHLFQVVIPESKSEMKFSQFQGVKETAVQGQPELHTKWYKELDMYRSVQDPANSGHESYPNSQGFTPEFLCLFLMSQSFSHSAMICWGLGC